MKRKFYLFVMLLLSVYIITGCSDKKKEDNKVNNTNITVEDNEKEDEKEEVVTEDVENEKTVSNSTTNKNTPTTNKDTTTTNNDTPTTNNDMPTTNNDMPTTNKDTETTFKNNTSNKNETTSNLTPSVSPQNEKKEEYTCPFGYTLEGNKCYKLYSPEIKYMCDYGESKSSICTYDTSVNANVDYSCPNGYDLANDRCVKEEVSLRYNPNEFNGLGSETAKASALNNFRNNCNMLGGTIRDNVCYTYSTQYATRTYNCDGKNGILAGNKCVSVETKKAFKKYNCKDKDILTPDSMCKNEINATKK